MASCGMLLASNLFMRRAFSKFAAVIMLVAVVWALGSPAMAMPASSPAACHGTSGPAHPAPVDFSCCQLGHSPALQPDGFRAPVAVFIVSAANLVLPLAPALPQALPAPAFHSTGPAEFFTPLRI